MKKKLPCLLLLPAVLLPLCLFQNGAQIGIGARAWAAAPPDPSTALRAKAEHGNAAAQYQLGLHYHDGSGGVPKDENEAAAWFNKAAEQWAGRAINGEAQAQYDLGLLYGHGYGVPQDDVKAFQLFDKAAKQGYAAAELSLGLAYTQGHGVARNIEEAYFWLSVAAKDADARAIKDKSKTEELREDAATRLTAAQKAETDKRAAEWKPVAEAPAAEKHEGVK